jgi:eukaryotic-like serine/threonine-protein kinase
MRCPHCGRRLIETAPICAIHGPAATPAANSVGEMPTDALCAALLARGYRVQSALGRGGFGAVYAAERVSDRAQVAIKLAHNDQPGATDRLQREAETLRAIATADVPNVLDADQLPEGFYLVMEKLAAPTLATRMLSFAGPAPLDAFSKLAYAVLAPVEVVHACGFLHCDLKPENILVEHTGRARLIDFGLARRIERSVQLVPADGAGTAEYMSPEQCDSLLCYRSSDVYSIGVLFYELLSGAPPFWGRAEDVREAHRSRRPLRLSRSVPCPPELEQLVRRCLAKDRTQRFDDVSSLRIALDKALRSLAATSGRARGSRVSYKPVTPLRSVAPAASREKRSMGLVFFESHKDLGAVQAQVSACRGQIVFSQDARFAAAFGHEAGANPARVALRAAQRLLASDITQHALVDVAAVSVNVRANGARRIFSPLLAKSSRYPSASDSPALTCTRAAAEVLPDLDFVPLPGRDRLVLAAAHSVPGDHEQLPPLVGREQVLERIVASAQQAAESAHPTLLTVFGPPGHGRTHLGAVVANELRASHHSFEVITLSAQEGASSQVLPKLLRRVLDLPQASPHDPKGLLLPLLGEAGEATWAGVAYALGFISAEHVEVRRLAAAPGTLRLIAARTVGEALQRMAADKPLALLLDDAHLADDATLDALQHATRSDAPRRIFVCALAPPSFVNIRPSWYSSGATAQHLLLTPLDPKHAVELTRQLLLPAEFIPEAVLVKLSTRTQGVPGLLVELARGLKRDGFIRKAERGNGYYFASDELDKLSNLPIVEWNASRELEALLPQLAQLARLASVLGSRFSAAELEALVAQLELLDPQEDLQLDPAVGVQRLVTSGILVRQPSGLIDFRNAILRDMLYQLIPDTQRTGLHRAAFEAYRALPMAESLRLSRVATHAARCGEHDIAAAAYLDLARYLARSQAYVDAEAAYSGALANLPSSDQRMVEATRGRGLMRMRLSRQEEALVDLRRARELAGAWALQEQALELMLDEAMVLDWLLEPARSVALVREMEAAARDVPLSPLLRARLAMSLARTHFRLGEIDAAIRAGNQAVQLAAALGDAGYETRIIAQLVVAPCYPVAGKLEEAERCFEQLIAEAESRGDLRHVAAALGNRAILWHSLNNVERLFADLARSAQLAREVGEAALEYVAIYNWAESDYALGQLPAARVHAQRMLELARHQFGETNREVSASELLLARIALYDGDLDDARRLAAGVIQRVERGRAEGDSEAELEPSARVLLQMVQLSVNAAPLTAWQELLTDIRSIELQPTEVLELLERAALSAAQLGEWQVGQALYKQARETQADKPSLIMDRIARRLGPLFDADPNQS